MAAARRDCISVVVIISPVKIGQSDEVKNSMGNIQLGVTIMLINMTIVFAVLFGLCLMIRIIHAVDPTNKKKEVAPAKAAAPAPAPAAAAVAAPKADNSAVIAVIAAAVAAYEGDDVKIVTVRPVESTTWKNAGRAVGIANKV